MRKPVLVLLVAVSFALGGPGPETMRGVVLDPEGRPLAGARVFVRAPNGCCSIVFGHSFRSAATDPDGRFRFEAPPEPMEVVVAHPDYAPAWRPLADGAVVQVEESAWIEGSVSAPAEIRAMRGLWEVAKVDANGAFRLGPLPAGVPLTLSVVSPGHRPATRRVVLEAGETARAEFALDAGLAVRGRIEPAVPGTIVRASQGEARESRAAVDANGAFVLTGLREGAVRLVVLAPGRDVHVVDGVAGGFVAVELDR